mmetsp:Transcript_12506/g.37583  ORF Transcript_12506/g.37583 Transcript_12506/m.37583 type:complete len:703 (-) Transcript_12506:1788-3896(-)
MAFTTQRMDEEEVYADPMAELAVRTAKHVKNCKELYMSGRGITQLEGFEDFVTLEVLWINDNALRRLDGFDDNFRLKELYAHNNKIESLRGSSVLCATFLRMLTLQGNQIGDLHGTLKVLKQMRHLEELDMQGNPLCEETNYRLHVIKNLPWLHVLDKHKVTEEELAQASRLRPPQMSVATQSLKAGKSKKEQEEEEEKRRIETCTLPPDPALLGTLKRSSRALRGESEAFHGSKVERRTDDRHRRGVKKVPTDHEVKSARAIKAYLDKCTRLIVDKRIYLRQHFLEEDPRRENFVTFSFFLRILEMYQMAPAEDEIDLEYGLNIRRLLLENFGTAPPVRAPRLGRDTQYADEPFIDYLSFCTATDPGYLRGSRDAGERDFEGETNWKYPVPVFSSSIRYLQRERTRREAATKRAREFARTKRMEDERRAYETAMEAANAGAPMAAGPDSFLVEAGMLKHWEVYKLKQMLRRVAKGNQHHLDAAKLRDTVMKMKEAGKVAVLTINPTLDPNRALPGEQPASDAEPKDAIDLIIDALKAESPGSAFSSDAFLDKVLHGSKDLLQELPDGSTRHIDVPPLRWRVVTDLEAMKLREDSFAEAKRLERQMFTADDAFKKQVLPQMHELTARASRMEGLRSQARIAPSASPIARSSSSKARIGSSQQGQGKPRRRSSLGNKSAMKLTRKFGLTAEMQRLYTNTHPDV